MFFHVLPRLRLTGSWSPCTSACSSRCTCARPCSRGWQVSSAPSRPWRRAKRMQPRTRRVWTNASASSSRESMWVVHYIRQSTRWLHQASMYIIAACTLHCVFFRNPSNENSHFIQILAINTLKNIHIFMHITNIYLITTIITKHFWL